MGVEFAVITQALAVSSASEANLEFYATSVGGGRAELIWVTIGVLFARLGAKDEGGRSVGKEEE